MGLRNLSPGKVKKKLIFCKKKVKEGAEVKNYFPTFASSKSNNTPHQ